MQIPKLFILFTNYRPVLFKPKHFISSKTTKMPKFCANLSFMFTEKPFLDRYKLAAEAGFKAVESGFPPAGTSKQELISAVQSSGLQQILLNVYTGDVTKGELGFTAIPGQEDNFRDSFNNTLEYAKSIGARKIHIMAGKLQGPATQANHETYETNLQYAVKILEKEGIVGLIEPINPYSIPNYYLNSYQRAVSVINKINSPNLKLMLDIFHLQRIQGNIATTIETLMECVGHVQIAQVPHRHEPDVPGELNFTYIFDLLEKAGYDDFIGLEYAPKGSTVEGLKWIRDGGYTL